MTCGVASISRDPTHIQLESQEELGGDEDREMIGEIMAEKFPNLVGRLSKQCLSGVGISRGQIIVIDSCLVKHYLFHCFPVVVAAFSIRVLQCKKYVSLWSSHIVN